MLAQQPLRRRGVRTPEFHFRQEHLTTPAWSRRPIRCACAQMRIFSAAVALLFSLVMVYGLQHFYAIESGYRVESEKQALDQLREENRQLRLTEAELTQPGRIDAWPASWVLPSRSPARWFTPTMHVPIQRSRSCPGYAAARLPAQ